ncbi:ABC transporter substrate-binding protein [Musicola paradisiaca]|uniref:Extracellular solute-binding protein family 3 n=1 Tax=Musicola paradisiaca (strain Ech703) TaxID=579405 RepID=C6C8W4_MUSP7|nr:ABC transporter substrate-binding protein [Musicola paradisiaca]ACS84335.1 extracellular solute-binding protein family 3 [Musicola paradisiaca Ech703]
MQNKTPRPLYRLGAILLGSWLLLGNALASGIDLKANQQPIHAPTNPQATALIPPGFAFAVPGKLTVAVASLRASPPLVLLGDDNKTLYGSEPDIARLVADSLGLELNIVPTSWEDWPLGVASGKYDIAVTNITVTKARKERFDFATYRADTLGFYVKSASPIKTIDSAKDIAGLKVIVGSGTNQEAILLEWDKQNRAQGLPPVAPIYSTDDAAATLSIQSGRADATFGPNVTGAYKASLAGNTRLVGIVNGGWPQAAHIAVTTRKGNGLVNAVNAALNGVIEGGQYDQVLNRWGESVERIARSEINPPGLGDDQP